MSGNRAIVGAACYQECAGVAYEFTRTEVGWSQVDTLSASDLAAGDYFGVSAAMSGDTAVVGAFPGRAMHRGGRESHQRSAKGTKTGTRPEGQGTGRPGRKPQGSTGRRTRDKERRHF